MSSRPSKLKRAFVRVAVVALLLVPAGGVVVGCQPMIPLKTPIVVRQSEARELTIRNTLDKPVTVLTVADRPGPSKTIAAGAEATVPFRLEEIGKLERLDPRPAAKDRRFGLGAKVTTIADPSAAGDPAYVGLAGVDAVVRIKIDDREHSFLIRLQDDCVWQAPPPGGFVLEIAGPPTAGVPERLCEDE